MFFKEKKGDTKTSDLARVAALLIHAAKIDENFSKEEEVIKEGKEIEENSNQILDFTREVKNMDDKKKIEIIETLWRIIYSNKEADMFETNLMRRLAGLLYIDNKIMGDIKEKIKKENQ